MFVLYALACYYATTLNHINPRFFSFTSRLSSDISLFRTHTHFFASSIMLSGCPPASGRRQAALPGGFSGRSPLAALRAAACRPALPPTGKRLPLTHPGQGGDPRLFTAGRINNSPRSVRSAPPESAPRSVSFCPFGLLLTLSTSTISPSFSSAWINAGGCSGQPASSVQMDFHSASQHIAQVRAPLLCP